MYHNRKEYVSLLEKEFDGQLVSYITSDRSRFETQIAPDAIDLFIAHLDKIGVVRRLILFLYTRGGDTSAAWNIVNLLRVYCDELYVIVPHKAHSAGTIISIGADKIIMTKQATLSPIDPSITTQLNPTNPIANIGLFPQLLPVSVEAVNGYIELAKKEFLMESPEQLQGALFKLTESIHPLVLGQAYRSRAQIRRFADRLLVHQIKEQDEEKKKEKTNRIIAFLCGDSGSHDYTINRREAEKELGLNIQKPNNEQYRIIKDLYDDFAAELGFGQIFDPRYVNGAFAIRRAFIESNHSGSDYFVTEARVVTGISQDGQNLYNIDVDFEGWRHESDVGGMPQQSNEQGGMFRYEATDEFGL